MGVSSSLYSSISGLSTMGEAMSVLGDNVANVNTVAFKSSRSTFQDVLSQSVSTAAGSAQVGRGVTLSAIDGLFAQGSFESSSTATDMAIGGSGFFMLRSPENSEAAMYSRAGEFRFDQVGSLVTPVGHYVQGWTISAETGEREGTIGDINIGKSTPPVATETVEVIANLDSRKPNETNEDRLFSNWNGTNAAAVNPTDPIDATKYDYTTAIKIFDSKGASHDLSIYFDRTTSDNEWEFLVTCDPTEDLRVLNSDELEIYNPDTRYNYESHRGAGALLYGTIQYDTSGNLTQIQAYKVPPDGQVDPAKNDNRILLEAGDSYFTFPTNFTGATTNQEIELNFGARYEGTSTTQRQVLVSQSGGRALSAGGDVSTFITSATTWSNVADSNGNRMEQGDSFIFEGWDNGSDPVSQLVYTVNPASTVQDLLDELEDTFNCSASIDAKGRLVLADDTSGDSSMFVTRFETISANNALPFGGTDAVAASWTRTGTGITSDGTTVVTTDSTLLAGLNDAETTPNDVSVGDTFAYTGYDVAGDVIISGGQSKLWSRGVLTTDGSTIVTAPATTLAGLRGRDSGAIAAGDVFTFTGTDSANVAVPAGTTFTVTSTSTIADLLTAIDNAYALTAGDAKIGTTASSGVNGHLYVTNTAGDDAILKIAYSGSGDPLGLSSTATTLTTNSYWTPGVTLDGTALETTPTQGLVGLKGTAAGTLAAGDIFNFGGAAVDGNSVNGAVISTAPILNGAVPVTADTTNLDGLKGAGADSISAADGDTFTLTGTQSDGLTAAPGTTYTVGVGITTIADLLARIEADFSSTAGDVTAVLDANGKIVVTDTTGGGVLDVRVTFDDLSGLGGTGNSNPWGFADEVVTQINTTADNYYYKVKAADTIQTMMTQMEKVYGLNAGDITLSSRGNIIVGNTTGKAGLSVTMAFNDVSGASTGANPWGLIDEATASTLAATNVFTVDSLSTISNMLDFAQNLYEDGDPFDATNAETVSTSLDEDGNLRFIENTAAGKLGVTIRYDDNGAGGAKPWGLTDGSPVQLTMTDSTGGLIDITTSKRMALSTGRAFSVGTGESTPMTAATQLDSVYDDNPAASGGPRQLAAGDSITFVGTKSSGTSVNSSNTYTVPANFTNTDGSPADVQDILDFVEGLFDCEASIDTAGRLVLTDRVADTVGSQSQLAITSVTYPTNTNGHDIFGAAGVAFDIIPADISSEDGSQWGDVVTEDFEPEALSTTQYANSSTTIFQDQDGFASGFLQSVSADVEGVITGHYSNGQVLRKAQVALADFSNLAGLKKEGGNIYTETSDSGAPVTGAPGTNGLGSIAPNALEQSNVDLGTEFVKLITVQRGFQANSKIITTTDDMLNDLINVKR